jgi:hypothetical protein
MTRCYGGVTKIPGAMSSSRAQLFGKRLLLGLPLGLAACSHPTNDASEACVVATIGSAHMTRADVQRLRTNMLPPPAPAEATRLALDSWVQWFASERGASGKVPTAKEALESHSQFLKEVSRSNPGPESNWALAEERRMEELRQSVGLHPGPCFGDSQQ